VARVHRVVEGGEAAFLGLVFVLSMEGIDEF
jgi:hypothetical protein